MKVNVLRLGHRIKRDERISTHVGLVARAFCADKIMYTGDKDVQLIESIEDVVERWGGKFKVEYHNNAKRIIHEFDGVTILLSMYGVNLREGIQEIQETDSDKILVILGGQKVPGEIYGLVDMNISVTNQPHSEVAALGVFLHELFDGKELDHEFKGAKLRVIPQKKGKKIKELREK